MPEMEEIHEEKIQWAYRVWMHRDYYTIGHKRLRVEFLEPPRGITGMRGEDEMIGRIVSVEAGVYGHEETGPLPNGMRIALHEGGLSYGVSVDGINETVSFGRLGDLQPSVLRETVLVDYLEVVDGV